MGKFCLSIGFVFLLLVTLGSCQTLEQISIDYLHPADITFPNQLRKVAIVDNTSDEPDEQLISEEKEPNEFRMEISRTVGYAHGDPKIAAESLAQEIADQNYFETVIICDSALRANDKFLRENTLSPEEVDRLATNLNVDFLIALESLLFKATRTVSYAPDFDCFLGTTDLKAYPTVRIYVPGKKTPMGTMTPADSIYWEEFAYSMTEANQALIPDRQLLEEGAEFAGTIPVKYLVPYWATGVRYFFTGQTATMRNAAVYARKNQWEEAYKLWKSAFEQTKKQKRKMQAAFNIALYYEMTDNLVQAEEWARKAQEIAGQIEKVDEQGKENPHKLSEVRNYYLTSQYVKELSKRKAALPKLNMQMERFDGDF